MRLTRFVETRRKHFGDVFDSCKIGKALYTPCSSTHTITMEINMFDIFNIHKSERKIQQVFVQMPPCQAHLAQTTSPGYHFAQLPPLRLPSFKPIASPTSPSPRLDRLRLSIAPLASPFSCRGRLPSRPSPGSPSLLSPQIRSPPLSAFSLVLLPHPVVLILRRLKP